MNSRASETSVSVITITRRRLHLLERAIRSVRFQDWNGRRLNHLVIVDDCDETAAWLERKNFPELNWKLIRRGINDESGPAHLARLRNLACELTEAEWISFLDDDNEFEPEHIRTLLASAYAHSSPAVYSYRKLFYSDGTPFLDEFWPWCRLKQEATQRYAEYVAMGFLEPGSNVARERIVSDDRRPRDTHIDMNVWLLQRDLLKQTAISDHFTEEDWLANRAEDDKLLEALLNAGVPIVASGVPSVRYYLGGYSNDFEQKNPNSEVWKRPSQRVLN